MKWENRIVSQGLASPGDFQLHESNFKIPNDAQKDLLSGVLSEVGWVQSVIVNKNTGKVIDGHLRVKMALDRGDTSVPVSYVSLDEEEEKLVLLTLDPIRSMALMDPKKRTELADSVETRNEMLTDFLGRMTDKRSAATSFLDGVIKKSAPPSVWCGETEYEKPEDPMLPLSFLLSFNDREEVFAILNAVKDKEGCKSMPEAFTHILTAILKSEIPKKGESR